MDGAKRKRSLKRGGHLERVRLVNSQIAAPARGIDLIALDEALDQLALHDSRKAELVKLRISVASLSARRQKLLGYLSQRRCGLGLRQIVAACPDDRLDAMACGSSRVFLKIRSFPSGISVLKSALTYRDRRDTSPESLGMAGTSNDQQAIFEVARKINDRDARHAYVQQMCGENAGDGRTGEALLRATKRTRAFWNRLRLALTQPSTSPSPRSPAPSSAPTKLLQKIGEGGFGVVYMADQTEPVKRRVALKIIKPGMDTRQGDCPIRGGAAGPGDDGSSEHRPRAGCRNDRVQGDRTS